MNSYKSVRDTAWSNKVAGYTLSGFYQDASTKIGQASIKGLIKNETDESGKFSFIGDEPIEAPFANGSTSESYTSDNGDFINDIITSGDARSETISCSAVPDEIGLQFYYNNDQDKSIGIGVSCKGTGEYAHRWYSDQSWQQDNGTYNDKGSSVDADWWTGMLGGDIIKTDTGYFASFSSVENYTENTSLCTANISKQTNMQISIRPYSYLTSVNKGIENLVPDKFVLYQNYPNPFNPQTTIDYFVLKDGFVTIKIYNILGKEIRSIVNEYKKQGMYSVKFNGEKLTSGIYFCRMQAGDFLSQKKLVLIK